MFFSPGENPMISGRILMDVDGDHVRRMNDRQQYIRVVFLLALWGVESPTTHNAKMTSLLLSKKQEVIYFL